MRNPGGGYGNPGARSRGGAGNAYQNDYMEQQNDEQINLIAGKVGQLKELSIAIGSHVKEDNRLLGDLDKHMEARNKHCMAEVMGHVRKHYGVTDVREVRLPSNDFPSKDPLVAEVEVLDSDLSFTVVALHLNPYVQWSEARYRAEQVRELALWLDGLGPIDPPGGPVAVLGDLNDTLDGLNDELDTLQPLEDRYTFATADTDEYTNVPFRSQIDHLALDDTLEALRHAAGTTEGVQVVRHDRLEPWSLYQGGWDDTQNVSDHRPVYVDLRLPPSRPRTAPAQFP